MLYVADSVGSSWSSQVDGPAVEALYAIVSHNTYCQKLLESNTVDSETFSEVLFALSLSAQFTFEACLARLATHHWDMAASKARESGTKAREPAPRGAEAGSRLMSQGTLMAICDHLQVAVVVGSSSSIVFHLCTSHPCLCVAQFDKLAIAVYESQVLAVGVCECTPCCTK